MPHWGTSSEFQRGEDRFKTRHYVILHVYLRHIFLLPVETRYTCLTKASRLSPPLFSGFRIPAKSDVFVTYFTLTPVILFVQKFSY